MHIRQAELYLIEGEELSFYEVLLRARQRREIVIGYRLANTKKVVINPPAKNEKQRCNKENVHSDPVKVIRDALAEALVFYYPFAGRLREVSGGKLVVDCTGEGVLFIEADADVRMEQFGEALHPPFPCVEELLYNVPSSDGILNSPLLLIQVTRLLCRGFIFALCLNHTMSDALGLVQFMMAIGEIARGAHTQSVQPVWQRELLNARDPPRVTCTHHEYDEVASTKDTIASLLVDVDYRSFTFGPTEFWPFASLSLHTYPSVRFLCLVNARSRLDMLLPAGYYGNAFVFPAAISTIKNLSQNSLGYALELVMKAKSCVTTEYVRSVADLMVTRGRPPLQAAGSWLVSDFTRVGLRDVDFGWGKAVYGGMATGRVGDIPGLFNLFVPFRDNKGENVVVVPLCLPAAAMERFVKVLGSSIMSQYHPAASPGPEQRIQRVPKDPRFLSMSPPSGEWFRDLVLQVGHSEITHATITFPGTTPRIVNEENTLYKPHRHFGETTPGDTLVDDDH
ncbi:hypothetical protein LguiB_009512 [Lonicera macranthoides]